MMVSVRSGNGVLKLVNRIYETLYTNRLPQISSAQVSSRHQSGSGPLIGSQFRNLILSRRYHGTTEGSSSQLQRSLLCCPGCGAYVNSSKPGDAGHYDCTRTAVIEYLRDKISDQTAAGLGTEGHGFRNQQLKSDLVDPQILGLESSKSSRKSAPEPMCDRCHNLAHHSIGVSIRPPPLQAVRDIIRQSEHDHNHIYHVLDAADFPLSLIPGIQQRLALSPLRSRNRRAKSFRYIQGRRMDLNFIITKADLLAPQKDQVAKLKPYLIETLRNALGNTASNMRLGNVWMISSKRGWWTSDLKEEIWKHGGATWILGKVNVGKSSLFENVFPKGRSYGVEKQPLMSSGRGTNTEKLSQQMASTDAFGTDSARILPPLPLECQFPVLPLVSSHPGTTALPVRLSFGNGKGEVIDTPGLERAGLEPYVRDEFRRLLLMQSRPKPQQFSLKPGYSMLLGGLIRITGLEDNAVMLATAFTTLPVHVSTTEKVKLLHAAEAGTRPFDISKSGAKYYNKPAGVFEMKWDVTKDKSGPLTRKDAGGIKPSMLPFRIFSMDILLEGTGWVELTMQVRKKRRVIATGGDQYMSSCPYPKVEISSPNGRHIGVRQPMNASLICTKSSVRKRRISRTS